jgi:uncharacterized protein (TIGR00251 family)
MSKVIRNERSAEPALVKLELKVIPSSSREEIVGWLGGALKIKVRAPPEKGRANKAVEALLAKALGLPKGAVSITSGQGSSSKTAELTGLTESGLATRLAALGITA